MKKLLFLITLTLILIPTKISALNNIFDNYIVMDIDSKRIFEEKNKDEQKLPASTTKIMTLIVALENSNQEDVVTVKDEILTIDGSNIYLEMNENILMQDLEYGMILRSGNDAAMTIARHTGNTVSNFVKLMNQKSKQLNLKNTHFNNPTGLDDNEKNISTVHDLSLIYSYGYKNKAFRDILKTKTYKATSSTKSYYFKNRSKILNMDDRITGAKTGYTPTAGRILVSSATNNNLNLVIASISKIDYGYQKHIDLYNKIFSNYKNYKLLDKNNLKLKTNLKGKPYIGNSFSYPLTKNEKENISKKIVYNGKKEDQVGEILIYLKDDIIHREKLYLKQEKVSLADKIKSFFKHLLN